MTIALLFGVLAFGASASLARWSIWQLAFTMSARYPSLDYELVYRHIRRRALNRKWLVFSGIGSALIFAGALFYQFSGGQNDNAMDGRYMIAGLVIGAGVVMMLSFAIVQAKKLFYRSVTELGIAWPPPRTGRSSQG